MAGFADGQGTAAMFHWPTGFVVHAVLWVIYIADRANNRIRTCTSSGNVGTLTGSSTTGNVDGSSSIATFSWPWGIVIDSTSKFLYVTCFGGHTLRQVVISTVTTTTIVGSGTFSYPRFM